VCGAGANLSIAKILSVLPDASVQKRLAIALNEIEYAKQPGVHDCIIVNDDLDRAYSLFERVALGEPVATELSRGVPSDTLPSLDDEIAEATTA
jgi:guanylate kinase